MSIASESYLVYCGENSTLLEALRNDLSDEEYRVDIVKSTAEVLTLFESEPYPDLLFLDNACTNIDIPHLAKALAPRRSNGGLALIALIALGDKVDEALIDQYYSNGIDDVLIKPVKTAYLKSKIRVWTMRLRNEKRNEGETVFLNNK